MTKNLLQVTFTRLDNNLFGYLADNTLDALSFVILATLNREADYSTGTWLGCAERLFYSLGQEFRVRTIQERLQALDNSGFIESRHMQGKRGYYPVLISNFLCASGPNKGKVLNPRPVTAPSVRPHRAVTAPSAHSGALNTGHHRAVTAPSPRPGATNQDTQDSQDKNLQDTQSAVALFSTKDSEGVARPTSASPRPGAVIGSAHSGAVIENVPDAPLPKWSARDGAFFDGDRELTMVEASRRFAAVGMSHLDAINVQMEARKQ